MSGDERQKTCSRAQEEAGMMVGRREMQTTIVDMEIRIQATSLDFYRVGMLRLQAVETQVPPS